MGSSGQRSSKPDHLFPVVLRRDMVTFEAKLLEDAERRCVPTAHRRPESRPPSRDGGAEDRTSRLGRVAAPVCTSQ